MMTIGEVNQIAEKVYYEIETALKKATSKYSIDCIETDYEINKRSNTHRASILLYINNINVEINKQKYPCLNTIALRINLDVENLVARQFHFEVVDNDTVKSFFIYNERQYYYINNNYISIPIINGDIDCPFITSINESVPNIDSDKSVHLHGAPDMYKFKMMNFKFIWLKMVFDN